MRRSSMAHTARPEITTYHEGRPIIRDCGPIIGVLCPYGHVYTSMPSKDWAGSWLEAKASDPNWTIKCNGTLPTAVQQ